MSKKIYAVGDIHGKYDLLDKALECLFETIQPEDTLVFLGDYIDRGKDSNKVLERMIDLKENRNNAIFLRGNHEQMMIDALKSNRDIGMWFDNGGYTTVKSYDKYRDFDIHNFRNIITKSHIEFVQNTVIEHGEENLYHFVHAGIIPEGIEWKMDNSGRYDARIWIRDEFIRNRQNLGKIVVFGHTPQITTYLPLVMPNKIGIDTGAVFGGKLSVIQLDSENKEKFALMQVDQNLSVTHQEIEIPTTY